MLSLAIVGAGIMGTSHARVAMGLRDADVTVIVDPDPERGQTLATATGARYERRVGAVLDDVAAAVLAVPTDFHHEIGLELIEAGISVLIEKPLASTVPDACALVGAAEARGVTLMVGHVERFNPAVLELDRLLTDVVHFAAVRISPFSPRVRDGVVLDLMIHDLDILLGLARTPVVSVQAVRRCLRSEAAEDLASALLVFENGMTANLTASRIGQQKIRDLFITQAESFVTVDLVRQDVSINRVAHAEFLSSAGAAYHQSGVVEIPYLEHHGEPLFLELQHFVHCVLTGRTPRVSGADGVAALRLVARVDEAARNV